MLDMYLSLMNKKTEVWKRNTGGINTEPVIIPSGSHQEGAGLCRLREYEISSNMSLQPSNDRRLSGCSPDGCAHPIAPTTEAREIPEDGFAGGESEGGRGLVRAITL